MARKVPIKPNIGSKLEDTAVILGTEGGLAQKRGARAGLQRNWPVPVIQEQTWPNRPHKRVLGVIPERSGREIEAGLKAKIGTQVPSPGKIAIHYCLNHVEVVPPGV